MTTVSRYSSTYYSELVGQQENDCAPLEDQCTGFAWRGDETFMKGLFTADLVNSDDLFYSSSLNLALRWV